MHAVSADLTKQTDDKAVVRALDSVLKRAVSEGALEVRIEPGLSGQTLRYLIKDSWVEQKDIPESARPGLVARIKLLANLNPDEHQHPQTGQLIIQASSGNARFRVVATPVFDGERVVLRRLGKGDKVLSFEELGFLPSNLALIKKNLTKPQGLTLVAGPVGSGKTTTLYSILAKLNTRGVSISTVEDPIEHHLPGLNQTQLSPGISFASGLRAALRADSDLIMLGEIENEPALEEAIHAATAGRAVLASFLAPDAAGAVSALLELGAEPYQLAYTLNAVIGQRLARRVCPSCKREGRISPERMAELSKLFDLEKLVQIMKREGLSGAGVSSPADLVFYESKGCKQCGQSGYLGRVGIYEILEVDEGMAELILSAPSAEQLREQAEKSGMVPLGLNGLIKAHLGMTTVEQVLSALRD
jgi:type II secretory ATPase GspE/PulE/Tfp pilus assembly ATPase PilB-like protein